MDEIFKLEIMFKEWTVSAEFLLIGSVVLCVNLVDYLKS